MKQIYIQPQTMAEQAQCEMLHAASMFNQDITDQSIRLTDDDYDGVFTVKEYAFGDDLDE